MFPHGLRVANLHLRMSLALRRSACDVLEEAVLACARASLRKVAAGLGRLPCDGAWAVSGLVGPAAVAALGDHGLLRALARKVPYLPAVEAGGAAALHRWASARDVAQLVAVEAAHARLLRLGAVATLVAILAAAVCKAHA